jgi:hypothetical protein
MTSSNNDQNNKKIRRTSTSGVSLSNSIPTHTHVQTMLRLRSVTKTVRGDSSEAGAGVKNHPFEKVQQPKRNPFAPPLPLVLLLLWCTAQAFWDFQKLMNKNVGVMRQRRSSTTSLRANASIPRNSTLSPSEKKACPALPDRLLRHNGNLLSPPLIPLSQQDVKNQMKYRKRDRMGTMGDIILTCPSHHRSRVDEHGRVRTVQTDPTMKACRGILKKYHSKAVYKHVKHCLTILKDTGITPRLLYSDDATLTLVEEDKGFLTMRNSPIPVDFDRQLRRILCILRKHNMVHRDVTHPNFVIDEITGMLYIIDFGDAYVATPELTFNWRNIQNLFTIWWNRYDEEARVEKFIADTLPDIRGDRQWRPPAHQWTSLEQNKIGSLLLSKELLK